MRGSATSSQASRWGLPLVLVTMLIAWAPAHATVTIMTDDDIVDEIPGVATFNTNGADMSGMSVRATFLSGLEETIAWAATGAVSGEAAGSGWSLSFDGGSTFSGDWLFVNEVDSPLTSLTLDGRPGLTLFDICGDDDEFCDISTGPCDAGGTCGTVGSAQGLDFFTSAGTALDIVATYSRVVALTGEDPVNDLWHVLSIDFGEGLDDSEWTFVQDTDNDIRRTVPAPGTLALLGAGLLLVGHARRRRH